MVLEEAEDDDDVPVTVDDAEETQVDDLEKLRRLTYRGVDLAC